MLLFNLSKGLKMNETQQIYFSNVQINSKKYLNNFNFKFFVLVIVLCSKINLFENFQKNVMFKVTMIIEKENSAAHATCVREADCLELNS